MNINKLEERLRDYEEKYNVMENSKTVKQHKIRFANNLSNLLQLNDISKAEFSKIIGISPSSVGYWTEGKTLPHEETRRKIAYMFKLHELDLYNENLEKQMEANNEYQTTS